MVNSSFLERMSRTKWYMRSRCSGVGMSEAGEEAPTGM
ncbi:Uncharacterised protein [Collinsella intestinalis]|nr:Uncharacterised protein [Collinsella intestinalis]